MCFCRYWRMCGKKRLFTLHAYCLMTNHFHLELTTAKDPIWMIMKPLMNSYAKYFNQKYGFEGHLFDSRYTSGLIEDEIYFLEVSRYIHLNPVKAKMVRESQAYEYSSYQVYIRESEQNCSHGNGQDNVQTDNLHIPPKQHAVPPGRLCCFGGICTMEQVEVAFYYHHGGTQCHPVTRSAPRRSGWN